MAHFTYPHQDFVHYIAYGELPYTALRRPSPLCQQFAAPPAAPNLPIVSLPTCTNFERQVALNSEVPAGCDAQWLGDRHRGPWLLNQRDISMAALQQSALFHQSLSPWSQHRHLAW